MDSLRTVLTGAEVIAAVIAAAGAVFMAIRKVYRLARNVEEVLEKLDSVVAQVLPNGGNSLHDKVTTLQQKVLDDHDIAVAAKHEIERLSDRLTVVEHAHASCANFEPAK